MVCCFFVVVAAAARAQKVLKKADEKAGKNSPTKEELKELERKEKEKARRAKKNEKHKQEAEDKAAEAKAVAKAKELAKSIGKKSNGKAEAKRAEKIGGKLASLQDKIDTKDLDAKLAKRAKKPGCVSQSCSLSSSGLPPVRGACVVVVFSVVLLSWSVHPRHSLCRLQRPDGEHGKGGQEGGSSQEEDQGG